MSFKLVITQTKADGTQSKIELENSEAVIDQAALLSFLQPLIQDTPAPADDLLPIQKAYESLPTPDPEKDPLVKNTNEPKAKAEVIEDKRETGVVQIHCPKCGLETAKHTPIKASYFPCPTCKTKLFLYALNEVRGKPNERGVSFKANNIYRTAQERYDMTNRK